MTIHPCIQVLIRGRHVFMGYLGHPEYTGKDLNDEGWMRSGDIGYIDKVSEATARGGGGGG